MSAFSISVQTQDFDLQAETAALCASGNVGAIATFIGVVRGGDGARAIHAMSLEHYPGMTEKALEDIVTQARERWQSVTALRVIHRVGRLLPGDRIVFVGVASAHRAEAFAACEFVMDYLKTRAPFWKKEETAAGARWVEARDSDDAAAARWQ